MKFQLKGLLAIMNLSMKFLPAMMNLSMKLRKDCLAMMNLSRKLKEGRATWARAHGVSFRCRSCPLSDCQTCRNQPC